MTAWTDVVDDLRREQLDRRYLGQPTPDPLVELIGILATLLGEEKQRIRHEASRAAARTRRQERSAA